MDNGVEVEAEPMRSLVQKLFQLGHCVRFVRSRDEILDQAQGCRRRIFKHLLEHGGQPETSTTETRSGAQKYPQAPSTYSTQNDRQDNRRKRIGKGPKW